MKTLNAYIRNIKAYNRERKAGRATWMTILKYTVRFIKCRLNSNVITAILYSTLHAIVFYAICVLISNI